MNGQYNPNDAYSGQTTSIFCYKCGSELTGAGVFCTACGTHQDAANAQSNASYTAYAQPQQPDAYTQQAAYTPPQQIANAKKKVPVAAIVVPIVAVVVVGVLLFLFWDYLPFSGNNAPSISAGDRSGGRNSGLDDDDRGNRGNNRDNEAGGSSRGGLGFGTKEEPARPVDSVDTGSSAPSSAPSSASGGGASGSAAIDTPPATQAPASSSAPPPEAPAVSAQPGLSEFEARERVETWLYNHPFPFYVDIDYSVGEYLFDNVEYYAFTLSSTYFSDVVYVNRNNGRLLIFEYYSDSAPTVPLDDWYYYIYQGRTLDEVIFQTSNWVRLYARWSANSVTVFERDRGSSVWTMVSRDGGVRMVDPDFSYQNGFLTMGFPTTTFRYTFYQNSTGLYNNAANETFTWEFETDPFYSRMSENGANESYDFYSALGRYSLITIHVFWPDGRFAIFYRQADGSWMLRDRNGGFAGIALNISGNANQVTISSSAFTGSYSLNSGGGGTFGNENVSWYYNYSDG